MDQSAHNRAIFSLAELAEATGLEPRTIRSYIERGLLPGPDTRGRNAAYGPEHLDRLRVIAKLRDARREITLEQIRLLLGQLSPDVLTGIARGLVQIGGIVDTDDAARGGDALAYLRSVRERADEDGRGGPKRRVAEVGEGDSSGLFRAADDAGGDGRERTRRAPIEELLLALQEIVSGRKVPPKTRGEPWHRFRITHDIELSVRGEFSDDQKAQLHRVCDHLHSILTRGV